MRYQMKQKLWTIGNDFTIKDGDDKDVFVVQGRAFSVGNKLSFRDTAGCELAYIEQKLLSFKTRYEIFRNGQLFAEVIKEPSFFKDKFTVDIPGPNDYEVSGDFWKHEYRFIRKGRNVAHVSQEFFTLTDTYGIDVVDGEDDITILATAIVIDLVHQSEKKHL